MTKFYFLSTIIKWKKLRVEVLSRSVLLYVYLLFFFFRKQYISAAAYAQSKLAQVMFSNYLDAKLSSEGSHVQVHSVHPGIVNTDLFEGTPIKNLLPFVPALIFKVFLFQRVNLIFVYGWINIFQTPVEGATPLVYCAVSPKIEGRGGTYISNCKQNSTSQEANLPDLRERLFDYSKRLCGIDEYGKPSNK